MSIFLSYRRADSSHALWLYPWLIEWFGRDNVFWDRKDIDVGTKFDEVIEQQIRASKAFVALITPSWLSALDEQGRPRLQSPEDWIRRETVLALHEGLLILPVLATGMNALGPDDVPTELKDLARIQMLEMGDIRFYDVLRERLERVVDVGARVTSKERPEVSRLEQRASNLLRRQIQRLQVRAVELIEEGRTDRATEELNEGSELLMALLDLLPGDATLDAQLGFLFSTTAQAFQAENQPEDAERYFDLAVSVFERVRANPVVFRDRPLDLASAIKGLGGVYYERDDPETAIRYYREALAVVPDYAYAWHDLFLALVVLANRGDVQLAALRESFEKTERLGRHMPGIGAAQTERLERQLIRFDPVRARGLLDRSRATNDRGDMAIAWDGLANAAYLSGQYDEAQAHATQALALYRELHDERATAQLLWRLAQINTSLGDEEAAANFYHQAQAAFEVLGDAASAERVAIETRIGTELAQDAAARRSEAEDLEAIVNSADADLAAYTPDEHPEQWVTAAFKRGSALLQLGAFRQSAFREAVQGFDRMLEIVDRQGSPEAWAGIHKSRGEAYRGLADQHPGAIEEAVRSFDRALEVFTRDGYPEEWADLMMSRGLALQFSGKDGPTDLREAIRSYDSAIGVYTRETHPGDWARMMLNRGLAYAAVQGSDETADAQEATRSFQAVVDAKGEYAAVAEAALAARRKPSGGS